MIVPNPDWDPWVEFDSIGTCGDLHGNIGHWSEGGEPPQRRIGFHMPKPEPVPEDPGWLLLP